MLQPFVKELSNRVVFAALYLKLWFGVWPCQKVLVAFPCQKEVAMAPKKHEGEEGFAEKNLDKRQEGKKALLSWLFASRKPCQKECTGLI